MKILFLGYDDTQTSMLSWLRRRGCEVFHIADPLSALLPKDFDLTIAYGYRHIVKPEHIDFHVPILNCHIGYLPYNRGAHPTYWAAVDGTPQGVTIHVMDAGIDTGPILWRKLVEPAQSDTFADIYWRCRREMENLFLEHIEDILKMGRNWSSVTGSYHKSSEIAAKYYKSDYVVNQTIEKNQERQ